jgi:hypothetical protein
MRHRNRSPAPRSRHRRAVRNRHEVLAAGRDGRQGHEVQVHHQEHPPRSTARRPASCPSPCSRTTAPACTRTSSLWKGDKPLFAGNGYAGLSDMALHAAGGLSSTPRRSCAFAAPTTNSYKRLVPGYEAPVNLAYSQRNRSAAIRIPDVRPTPRPSAWSSAAPIRAAIRISRSRRC